MSLIETPLAQFILSAFTSLTNKILLAALAFLLGSIVARMMSKLTSKILNEIELDSLIKKTTGIETAVVEVLSIIVSIVFYGITALLVLKILGVDLIVAQAIGIIIIVIIIASLLMSLQFAIPNIFAGFLLRQKKIIAKGDHLKLRSISGIITHSGLFEITVQTKEKEIVYIPNRSLLNEKHFSVKRHR
ncbi:MAG: mechanosensitive ion channel domain-containing protein [Nanoarchaeota archaeon]